MDITKLELWELWKLRYELLASMIQTQQSLDAVAKEIDRRNLKDTNG